MRRFLSSAAAASLVAGLAQADAFVGSIQMTNTGSAPFHLVYAQPLSVLFDAAAIASGTVTVEATGAGPFRAESAGEPVFRIVSGRQPGAFAFPTLAMGGGAGDLMAERQAVAPIPGAPPMDGELYVVVDAIVSPGCAFAVAWKLDLSPQPEE